MRYGKYRFLCRLQSEAVLPPYKGSTFRGVFGRALKKVVCALKFQSCEQCLLQEKCLYTRVFEPCFDAKAPDDVKNPIAPNPFVIEPPRSFETIFPEEASFDFNLLLFGSLNDSLPYFIYAFEQMGIIGIGRKINGSRGRYMLDEVWQNRQKIYDHAGEKLIQPQPGFLGVDTSKEKANKARQIKLILETPLRLKFKNRLAADLPFHILVRAMLRRAASLLSYYGPGEPHLDYRGLVGQAENVRVIDNRLKWFDWRRYSFRQERAMLMGGMIGSVTYEGPVARYLPLLNFCSEAHLGKQTTFGLGKFRVETIK